MKKTNRKQTRVKGTEDRRVVELFVKNGQFLLPMIDLIEESSAAIDEMIDVVGRGAVEAVLQLSAQELTGGKSQGARLSVATTLPRVGHFGTCRLKENVSTRSHVDTER